MLKPISITDRYFFENLFALNKSEHNEYNFVTMFAYAGSSFSSYFEFEDWVIICIVKKKLMLWPLNKIEGKNITDDKLQEIIKIGKENGLSGEFTCVPLPQETDGFDYDRDNSDYIYETEKLINLSGKLLAKKRNLISQFKKLYPNNECRALTDKDNESVLKLASTWLQEKGESTDLLNELDAIKRSLKYQRELDIHFTGVFVDNELQAFATWNRQTKDMACVHFEKYNVNFKGMGQIINQITAKNIDQYDIPLINREQDLGLKGLRQAKMSYAPLKLIDVYSKK